MFDQNGREAKVRKASGPIIVDENIRLLRWLVNKTIGYECLEKIYPFKVTVDNPKFMKVDHT